MRNEAALETCRPLMARSEELAPEYERTAHAISAVFTRMSEETLNAKGPQLTDEVRLGVIMSSIDRATDELFKLVPAYNTARNRWFDSLIKTYRCIFVGNSRSADARTAINEFFDGVIASSRQMIQHIDEFIASVMALPSDGGDLSKRKVLLLGQVKSARENLEYSIGHVDRARAEILSP